MRNPLRSDDVLADRGLRLSLGGHVHDPTDPVGARLFADLGLSAEFEAELAPLRIGEGMAVARAQGRLRGRQPKLNKLQQDEIRRLRATGEYSISFLAKVFDVSRPNRVPGPATPRRQHPRRAARRR